MWVLTWLLKITFGSSKMMGVPIFTEWWEIVVFLLLGLIVACIGVILSPIFVTKRFIEYIRKT